MYEESYEYDAAGNIRYTTDNCCEENSYSYTSNNRLKSYNGYNVGFDEDGNMLYFYQDGTKCSLTYDSSNRLLSAKSCKYTYNAENTRIKKVYGSTATTYVYNTVAKLSQLLVMKKGSTITKYVYGLGLIGEECNGAFKTYHFDYRGSTVALTNINGVVTNIFTYDTYGKLTEGSSSVTPFLYNGRDGVITDENGLYYMRARYYSPDLKRFVNADIVRGAISDGVTLNRYAYADCNPVTNIDPLGLYSDRNSGGISVNNLVYTTGTVSKHFPTINQQGIAMLNTLNTMSYDYAEETPQYSSYNFYDATLDYGNLFDSMDDAAIAFANCYNAKSIDEMREYASFIYEVEVPIRVKTVEGVYCEIFGFKLFKICDIECYKIVGYETKYSYVKPKQGDTNSYSTVPINWFWWYDKVAEIHTHGSLEVGGKKDDFSGDDLEDNEYINYVATPYGTVRKYVPGETHGESEIIYENAPYDIRKFSWR